MQCSRIYVVCIDVGKECKGVLINYCTLYRQTIGMKVMKLFENNVDC